MTRVFYDQGNQVSLGSVCIQSVALMNFGSVLTSNTNYNHLAFNSFRHFIN